MARTRNLGNLTDLLTAGSTYVTAATPPQFDNSQNLSTTAWAQALGEQFSSIRTITAAATLTVADAGKLIYLTGSSAYTVTLPAASTMPSGTTINIVSAATGTVTISRANSDNIQVSSSSVTSLNILQGDSINIVSNGISLWVSTVGSIQLAYSSAFASSLGTSGYQKFPSGLIMQWGQYSTTGTSTPATVSYPISYPFGTLSLVCAPLTGLTLGCIDSPYSWSPTGFTVLGSQVQASSSNYSAHSGQYISFGR